MSKLISLEQALYTSVKGRQSSGYQLASISPGITPELARELSRWGPAHDCLEEAPAPHSFNFHPLDPRHWCLSETQATGAEYSGRRGARIVTQMFVLHESSFAAFDFQPVRALQAIRAAVPFDLGAAKREQLPSRHMRVPTLLRFAPSAEQSRCLIPLLELVRRGQPIGLISQSPPRTILKRLFDCLDPVDRRDLSFTTGLRFSLRRPFRLYFLPAHPQTRRAFLAQSGVAAFDLDFLDDDRDTRTSRADRVELAH
ncbi:MAG: hypothetical protein FJ295_15675 [Planctomycetes bacterium]|nr:hypothetical protein [Planctomycetota bacterium]